MTITRNIRSRELLFFALLGIVSFLPFLGAAPLFDWDEINFAESAREMLVTGNYFQVQIDFEPFWEKPPLFIWLQALSMKIFGVNEFAARFPNALIGVVTLSALYYHGSRMRNNLFGKLVAAFYFISILPHVYFKSGIIDPTFNFFIFLGLIRIIQYEIEHLPEFLGRPSRSAPWMAGYWIGMATLTKGPVALLIAVLVYFVYKVIWSRRHIPWLALVKFTVIYLLVILSWFGSIVLFTEDGMEIVRKFIIYQAELFSQPVAGHGQPFFYHPVVFLIGCFPLAAFAIRGMFLRRRPGAETVLRNFCIAWFWVVMILFSIVQTKIVHYSSLLYYPGAFLAALFFYELIRKRQRMRWDNYAIYGLGMLVFGPLVCLVNILAANPQWLDGIIKDPFGKAALQTEVEWMGWEFIPAVLFMIALLVALFFLIRKKYAHFMLVHLIAIPIYINGINALVLPRIADYSQNAAIEFFKEKSKEDAYFIVTGYKSYAQYFYGKVKPFPYPEIPREKRDDWLTRGEVDRPVYMVTNIKRADREFEEEWFPQFKRLYSKGGFVFYVRETPNHLRSRRSPA